MEKNQQIIENAVEIAMNNLRELQNTVDMGRDRLISDFILKWAEEAEPEYQRVVNENGGDYPYYDFIDEFSEKKMVEVTELCRKGSLPTVPSANTVREDFNGELKHIRSFSEKCLEDIKAIVREQPNQTLEIPFSLSAAYLLIQDKYDGGIIEERVWSLVIDGDSGLVMECEGGTYYENETTYPDIVYPYLLDVVYETLESMEKTKPVNETSSSGLHILTIQWNYDGEFDSETHVFHDHASAEAYMRKQYEAECENNPNWTDRDICQCSAHIFKDGESSDHHIVWKITENKVK